MEQGPTWASRSPKVTVPAVNGWLSLSGGCRRRAREEYFGLDECGLVLHRGEELAGLAQRHVGMRIVECEQAAPLPEQGVGVLWHVPELPPAARGLLVETRGFGIVTGRFRQSCAAVSERMLLKRRNRLHAVDETARECWIVEGERCPHQFGQPGGVARVVAGGGQLLELGEECVGRLCLPLGEQQPRGVGECHGDDLRFTARACAWDQLVRTRGLLVRALLGEKAQLDRARLGSGDVPGLLQPLRECGGFGECLLGSASFGEEARARAGDREREFGDAPALAELDSLPAGAQRNLRSLVLPENIGQVVVQDGGLATLTLLDRQGERARMSCSPWPSPSETRANPR